MQQMQTDLREQLRNRLALQVDEVAELLGLSRSAAYRAVQSGELPSFRINGRVAVPTDVVLELVEKASAEWRERRQAS